jgi:hypothetical protein
VTGDDTDLPLPLTARVRWRFPEIAAVVVLTCALIEAVSDVIYSIAEINTLDGVYQGGSNARETLQLISSAVAWVDPNRFALLVVGALALAYWQYLTALQSEDWPSADGIAHVQRVALIARTILVFTSLSFIASIVLLVSVVTYHYPGSGWYTYLQPTSQSLVSVVLTAITGVGTWLLMRRCTAELT